MLSIDGHQSVSIASVYGSINVSAGDTVRFESNSVTIASNNAVEVSSERGDVLLSSAGKSEISGTQGIFVESSAGDIVERAAGSIILASAAACHVGATSKRLKTIKRLKRPRLKRPWMERPRRLKWGERG
eukprot:SAG31_NODE_14413_length_807_cov_4.834746_1_plen_129_part_01